MLWGKSIFPHFHVNAPMPFATGQTAPEAVPADISAAIEAYEASIEAYRDHLNASTAVEVGKSREALKAVILKHLRVDP